MKRYNDSTLRRPRRGGFTLIELMMVIAVIAVLVALIIPALNSTRRAARIAEVRTEISQLEAAINDFKAKFNKDLPSKITLHETASGWTMDPQARALVRGIWNKYDFATRDLNGDGNATDTIILRGDQALVFCLGGMYSPQNGFIGFSSNPTNPFDTSSPAATRIGPFFDFEPSRIFDGTTGTKTPPATYPATAPLDRFPVYVDPLPGQVRPYLYACSYNGLGYNDSTSLSDVSTPVSDSNPNDSTPEFRIYLTNTKASAGAADPPPWKPKGFQIISPGEDTLYGIGGPFKPDGNLKLPARVQSGGADVADSARFPERDNITNFHSGALNP